MKRKVVPILLVIVLVLALIVAGTAGFLWYRENHVFVEGKPYPIHATSLDLREEDISFGHYDSLRSLLPQCQIVWNVPFQSGKLSSDTTAVTVSSLTQTDVKILLDYFPNLQKLDATGCGEYAILESVQQQRPQWEVVYQVDVGGSSYPPDTTELVLEPGQYTLEALRENLPHLPQVTAIQLKKPELPLEQIEQLKQDFEAIDITCTVEILGTEYDTQTTALDLSGVASADIAQVAEKLALLPCLESVELVGADGVSSLSKADAKLLMQAAPQAKFHYTFDFFGTTLSADQEEVHIKNTKIGTEGLEEVRQALDLMTGCKRFVLENCQIPNEEMAKLREDYRDKTKVVWRVNYGKGSTMTDVDALRAVYDLVDDNSENLKYCEDVKYIDFGHNEYLDSCEFVAGMPNLEYIILSGSPIKDLTPFTNCKKLKFLEIAFCGYIDDLTPLAQCTSLEKLNIANTKVKDLSPLKDLPLTHLTMNDSKVSREDREAFAAEHPDCLVKATGNPYGAGWRYVDEKNTQKYPYYAMLADVFGYPENTFNHTGKYTDITIDAYLTEEEKAAMQAKEQEKKDQAAQSADPAETTSPTEPVETTETTPAST